MTTTKNEKRICRLCGEEKAIELFEVDTRVKSSYTTRCKACKNALDDRSSKLYRRLRGRAQEEAIPLEVTRKELQALFAAFDGKCIYCGKTEAEAGRSHHVDHVIPTKKGGRHHASNLVLACASCNTSKKDATFVEFYLRKKNEISDDSFNTMIHFIALMSGQTVAEVLTDFIFDYKRELYSHLSDIIDANEFREIIRESVIKEVDDEKKAV